MKELTNWDEFRNSVVSMYDSGANEIEIGKKFEEKKIRWGGRIKRLDLDQEFAKSISVKMSEDLLPLADGKLLRANHLSLNIDASEVDEWSNCKEGDRIDFEATISSGAGPFNVIDMVTVENDPEVMLMVKIRECKLVSISSCS